jgi:aldehyde dehydrogenase (NAD+)
MSEPAAVVEAYFAAVTAGDPSAVGALFATDAELHNATGTLRGSDEITRMYEAGLKPGAMKPNPGPLVVEGDRVAVEIDLSANGKQVLLGDFFTIRSGRIQRLAIYSLTPADGRLFDDLSADSD